VPTWSLARQGLPPTALPAPGRGYSRTAEKLGGVHTSLNGRRTRDVVARKRTYVLPYARLSDAQFRLIEQYDDGSMGLGPFEYREPAYPGVVMVNVASLSDDTPLYADWHACTLVLEEV
jgi:hypothetical protein